MNFSKNFSKPIKWIWILFFSFWIGLICYIFAVKGDLFGLFGAMPDLEVLENPRSEVASILYAADGSELGKYFRENRSPVSYKQISPNLLHALIATEDVRFEEHSGIDLKGTFAIFMYMVMGQSRGSSTISQQLAKNLFSTRSEKYEGLLSSVPGIKTLIIKTKEWITAIKIERAYTKSEIITMYLNTVDFGSNAYGIKTAAQTFFNTSADRLTVPQAAVLVGLLKAPSFYSPIFNPERSKNRRNTVIEQMQKYKYITMSDASMYKAQPLTLTYSVENHNQGQATYFRTVVHNYLQKWCKEKGYDLYADGLKIYTTIDATLQKYAEEAIAEHMKYLQGQFFNHWKGRNPWVDEHFKEIPNFVENAIKRTDAYRSLKATYEDQQDSIDYYLNKKKPMRVFSYIKGDIDTLFSSIDSLIYYKKFLQVGMMSMDPESGHIKAWVGGVDHKYFKYDHVKQSKRQPGSTFKPFVYTAALDNGYSPCYKVQDAPVSFYLEDMQTTWTPQNSDGPSTGEYLTLRQAMARSVNTITAFLMKKVGPQTVVNYATKMGIKGPIDAVPALCLGISDVSVYEMVGAYSTFVNKGIYTEPMFITRIEDKNGHVIEDFLPKTEEALNEETAYLMLHMLMGGTQERGGTALGLHRYKNLWGGNEVGGKTGTTQNYSDGWFMGVTPSLVSGVWVGGDDRSIHFRDWNFGQGARMALPIFGLYMDKAYGDPNSGVKKGYFKRPAHLNAELNCAKYQSQERDSTLNPVQENYQNSKTKEEF